MDSILTQLSQIGIVPVIQLERAEDAVPLAKALMAGGLPCAEITFRTAAGEEAIRKISQEVPEMLVGAGTVLTTEQAERASRQELNLCFPWPQPQSGSLLPTAQFVHHSRLRQSFRHRSCLRTGIGSSKIFSS